MSLKAKMCVLWECFLNSVTSLGVATNRSSNQQMHQLLFEPLIYIQANIQMHGPFHRVKCVGGPLIYTGFSVRSINLKI